MGLRWNWLLVTLALGAIVCSSATATAGTPCCLPPQPPLNSPPAVLVTAHGIAQPLTVDVHEQASYLPIPENGIGSGYDIHADPASLDWRSRPTLKLRHNELVQVALSGRTTRGVSVTYDSVNVGFGWTHLTLPVTHPVFLAAASGMYQVSVETHYTWSTASETGDGTARLFFMIEVARPRVH